MGNQKRGAGLDAVGILVELARRDGHPGADDGAALLRSDAPLDPEQCGAVDDLFAVATAKLTRDQYDRLTAALRIQGGNAAQLVQRHALPPAPAIGDAGQRRTAPTDTVDTAAVNDDTVLEVDQVPERPTVAAVSRRRWPLRVGVAVGIATVAATGYLAWSNYETGQRWRERAAAAEADVDRLVAANEKLHDDLERTRAALDRSELDVSQLERRVGRLANEKARVEDEREQANAMAERIAEIAAAYDSVATQFQYCVNETNAFTDMVIDADYYYRTGMWYLVSSQASAADRACGAAQSDLWTLRSYVDALAGG